MKIFFKNKRSGKGAGAWKYFQKQTLREGREDMVLMRLESKVQFCQITLVAPGFLWGVTSHFLEVLSEGDIKWDNWRMRTEQWNHWKEEGVEALECPGDHGRGVGAVERVAATGLEIYQVRLENLPMRLECPCWTQWALVTCSSWMYAISSFLTGLASWRQMSHQQPSPLPSLHPHSHCQGSSCAPPLTSIELSLLYIIVLDFRWPMHDWILLDLGKIQSLSQTD